MTSSQSTRAAAREAAEEPNESLLRRADLGDLHRMLRERHARKADAVVPAAAITARGGVLHVRAAIEPELGAHGVIGARDAALRPTRAADGQIADKLQIPVAYLRRLRVEAPEVYDANVNGLLAHQDPSKRYLVRGLVDGPDVVPDLAPASDADMDTTRGILRALLSDQFLPIEDLDVLLATLDGVRKSGYQVEIRSCDLTENRMYVTVACPEVAAMAPALLGDYRSPFTGHRGAENPLVFAGFVFTNSETGSGRYSLTPRIEAQVCLNRMSITRDAVSAVHLGGKLEAGPVRWSADTTQRATDLITAKTRDAVATFLAQAYLERQLAQITAEASTPIADVTGTVEHVTTELHYSKAQAEEILGDFISGGDRTAGGVMHAVTSAAQRQTDAETAHAMEADGLRAMTLAARMQPT
jgi:hypothetical protein